MCFKTFFDNGQGCGNLEFTNCFFLTFTFIGGSIHQCISVCNTFVQVRLMDWNLQIVEHYILYFVGYHKDIRVALDERIKLSTKNTSAP